MRSAQVQKRRVSKRNKKNGGTVEAGPGHQNCGRNQQQSQAQSVPYVKRKDGSSMWTKTEESAKSPQQLWRAKSVLVSYQAEVRKVAQSICLSTVVAQWSVVDPTISQITQ